jgi:hypothetical protein
MVSSQALLIKKKKKKDMHVSSVILTHFRSAKTVYALDRAVAVVGVPCNYSWKTTKTSFRHSGGDSKMRKIFVFVLRIAVLILLGLVLSVLFV